MRRLPLYHPVIRAVAVLVGLASLATGAAAAAGLPLKPVARVALPGPGVRFDYTSIDPGTNKLYIAHMNADELLVFDLHGRRVIRTIPAPGIHGVLAVPRLQRVFASATDDHALLTINSRTGRVLNRAPAGEYPDGIAYDPVERHVFVSDESGGIEAVFDHAGRRIATIDVGGEAGNVQYDTRSAHVLAAVRSRNDLAVIDPKTNRVIRRVALAGCRRPHGLLVDPARRLAYVACAGNATLLTLDLGRMSVIGRSGVGGSPDVLAFDSSLKRLYVAAESGEVAVFVAGPRGLTKLGQQLLAPRAHTVAVDPRSHLVYFPLETGSAGRPELLVMAPTAKAAAAPSGETTEHAGGPVPAPARAGAWRQIGGSVTADPGAALHFYRIVENPNALGLVVISPSPDTVRVDWSSYCELFSDDDETLEDSGTVTGVDSVAAFPSTFPGATLCYVWVSADAPGTTKLTGAVFAT